MVTTCNVSASRTTRRYSTAVARWRPSGENTGLGPVHLYVSEKSVFAGVWGERGAVCVWDEGRVGKVSFDLIFFF
jgi:hypothetical protein